MDKTALQARIESLWQARERVTSATSGVVSTLWNFLAMLQPPPASAVPEADDPMFAANGQLTVTL